jgi:hypothetical protein
MTYVWRRQGQTVTVTRSAEADPRMGTLTLRASER